MRKMKMGQRTRMMCRLGERQTTYLPRLDLDLHPLDHDTNLGIVGCSTGLFRLGLGGKPFKTPTRRIYSRLPWVLVELLVSLFPVWLIPSRLWGNKKPLLPWSGPSSRLDVERIRRTIRLMIVYWPRGEVACLPIRRMNEIYGR